MTYMSLRASLFRLCRKESQTKRQQIKFPTASLFYIGNAFLTAVSVGLWHFYMTYTKSVKKPSAPKGLILRLQRCTL